MLGSLDLLPELRVLGWEPLGRLVLNQGEAQSAFRQEILLWCYTNARREC